MNIFEPLDCNLLDISLKGIKIALGQKLEKDTFLKLILLLSQEFSINVQAWVAWYRVIDGHNLYGLYFDKISDLDKETIYQFTRKYCPGQITKQWRRGVTLEKVGETMESFEDRRTFERFPVKLALRFLDLKANREVEAQTYDISAKGIGLATNQELTTQTPLEMWLAVPDKGEPFYARGEVAWSKMVEPNSYRVGINLERADLMGVARVLRAM